MIGSHRPLAPIRPRLFAAKIARVRGIAPSLSRRGPRVITLQTVFPHAEAGR